MFYFRFVIDCWCFFFHLLSCLSIFVKWGMYLGSNSFLSTNSLRLEFLFCISSDKSLKQLVRILFYQFNMFFLFTQYIHYVLCIAKQFASFFLCVCWRRANNSFTGVLLPNFLYFFFLSACMRLIDLKSYGKLDYQLSQTLSHFSPVRCTHYSTTLPKNFSIFIVRIFGKLYLRRIDWIHWVAWSRTDKKSDLVRIRLFCVQCGKLINLCK